MITEFDYPITPATFGINSKDVLFNPQGDRLVASGEQVTASSQGINLRITAGQELPCDFECAAHHSTLELSDSSGQINRYAVVFQCDI
ncbi:hypothetical protein [Nitrincola tapanii]|uniref:Uncharacterized protein n=1 Tax=Nitrincola tapanii TaxID=1708751 RepID=A0A5A9W092_9GAMM|nr:hypothetical protein [Nitrincola tapanii]KAA0874146.1 hypothetical protein E1H14_10240 [Nitrincola tapanii]